jgi:hypothetical protein
VGPVDTAGAVAGAAPRNVSSLVSNSDSAGDIPRRHTILPLDVMA